MNYFESYVRECFFIMKRFLINLWTSILSPASSLYRSTYLLLIFCTCFVGGLAVLMSRAGGVGGSMGRGGGGGDIFKVGRSPAKKVNKVRNTPRSSINQFYTTRMFSFQIKFAQILDTPLF